MGRAEGPAAFPPVMGVDVARIAQRRPDLDAPARLLNFRFFASPIWESCSPGQDRRPHNGHALNAIRSLSGLAGKGMTDVNSSTLGRPQ